MFPSFTLCALLPLVAPLTEAARNLRRLSRIAPKVREPFWLQVGSSGPSTMIKPNVTQHSVLLSKNRKVAALFAPLANPDTTFSDCHPSCKWNCQGDCEQVCSPVCAPPQCETVCGEAEGCGWHCEAPICAVVCPGACAHGQCPKCKTVCGPPRCQPRCNPTCESRCSDPQCSWKCNPDPKCAQPNCALDCSAPKVCQLEGDLNARPNNPMPAGAHVMARGLANLDPSSLPMPGLPPPATGLLPNPQAGGPAPGPAQPCAPAPPAPAAPPANNTAGPGQTPPNP